MNTFNMLTFTFLIQFNDFISFYLIKLWHVVCGHDALIKQVNDRCLKIVQRSTVMNPSLIQNQVHHKQRVLLWPNYRDITNTILNI